MTDNERIADLERTCRKLHDAISAGLTLAPGLMTMLVTDAELLLRIVRDQRAELVQARQAITNMRNAINGN